MTEPLSSHKIEWFIAGGMVYGITSCESEEGARCRLRCSVGCESWSTSDHEHPLVDGDCTAVEWFDNDGLPECCSYADEVPLRNGPVNVRWMGDFYQWEYADD